MKKIILTSVLLAFVFSATVNAQEKPKATTKTEACCKKDKKEKKCDKDKKTCCSSKKAATKS